MSRSNNFNRPLFRVKHLSLGNSEFWKKEIGPSHNTVDSENISIIDILATMQSRSTSNPTHKNQKNIIIKRNNSKKNEKSDLLLINQQQKSKVVPQIKKLKKPYRFYLSDLGRTQQNYCIAYPSSKPEDELPHQGGILTGPKRTFNKTWESKFEDKLPPPTSLKAKIDLKLAQAKIPQVQEKSSNDEKLIKKAPSATIYMTPIKIKPASEAETQVFHQQTSSRSKLVLTINENLKSFYPHFETTNNTPIVLPFGTYTPRGEMKPKIKRMLFKPSNAIGKVEKIGTMSPNCLSKSQSFKDIESHTKIFAANFKKKMLKNLVKLPLSIDNKIMSPFTNLTPS